MGHFLLCHNYNDRFVYNNTLNDVAGGNVVVVPWLLEAKGGCIHLCMKFYLHHTTRCQSDHIRNGNAEEQYGNGHDFLKPIVINSQRKVLNSGRGLYCVSVMVQLYGNTAL